MEREEKIAIGEMQNNLFEHSEYSAICDKCDAESTRDGSSYLAAQKAIAEGFLSKDFAVLCATCSQEAA